MPVTLDDKLVVAISSRALFDFEEENRIFDPLDPKPYMQLQLERLTVPAKPGVAFSLVQKLLAFNQADVRRVEVVMLSRNDPVSALRIYHSAQAAGLQLERGVFTQGRDPFKYLRPLGAHLCLRRRCGAGLGRGGTGLPGGRPGRVPDA
jgi:5'-nucleotidase